MIKTTPASTSVCTSLRFDECLRLLRQKLERDQFRVFAQIELHRDFEDALGLPWRKQAVLIVWNSFYAYQGSLSGDAGGLLLPFNISVSDHMGGALITVLNHGRNRDGSVGIEILGRELDRRIQQILMEFVVHEKTAVSSVTVGAAKESL